MNNTPWHATVELYKCFERAEHISLDDVLNKVTQEVIELTQAEKESENKMYGEAGDVLINIASIASELGCDMNELLLTEKWEGRDIFDLLWAWNEQVQAFRWKYSRKQWTLGEVESLTKSFISTLLNYTNPDRDIQEILRINLRKLIRRKDMYKPEINVKDYIAEYPDFPKPGINFKDISPILTNPDALNYVAHEMAEQCRGADKIVALDARGFIFAPLISKILWIPWVMCRKKWKLPGAVEEVSYGLEYGSDVIEIQKWAISEGEQVAVVDDLLATGGTAMACVELVEKLWWVVHNCAFVISLDEQFLLGQEKRKEIQNYNTSTVVSYD